MGLLWAALGWVLGSLLPALETAYLAYRQGRNSEIIQRGKEQIEAAQASNAQVVKALDLKQRLDAAGAGGAERMRAWFEHHTG